MPELNEYQELKLQFNQTQDALLQTDTMFKEEIQRNKTLRDRLDKSDNANATQFGWMMLFLVISIVFMMLFITSSVVENKYKDRYYDLVEEINEPTVQVVMVNDEIYTVVGGFTIVAGNIQFTDDNGNKYTIRVYDYEVLIDDPR